MHHSRRRNVLHAALAALALAAAHSTDADDEPELARVPLPDGYREECGACHVPYSPRLLPGASWQRIMQDLAQHFGTDASLDPATTERMTAWLTTASGSARTTVPPPPNDRITRSRWFMHEHAELPVAVFGRKSIGSAANCAACHTRADQGDFDEHRIPR